LKHHHPGEGIFFNSYDKKNVKLYMPILINHAKFFGEKETIERMGIPANLIPDYKSSGWRLI